MENLNFFDISEYYNVSIDVAKYLCRNKKTPYCHCGDFKILKSNHRSKVGYSFYRCCGKTECEPNFGKRRPNHSILMKHLVKYGSDDFKNTLMKPGNLFNKEVNSLSFKIKRLIKHGYDFDENNEESIISAFSLLQRNIRKNISTRKKEILNRYNNWEDEYKSLILIVTNNIIPTMSWLDSLSDNQINLLWSRTHGINTIRNSTRIKTIRSSFFKHEILSGFKFNIDNKSEIFVRSGLEKKYIEFFENTGIFWRFEPFVIETMFKDGFHVPDFFILLNGELILLETKGSFFRQPLKEYYPNKILSAIEFCNKNNYRYILTQKNPDKMFNFIENALIDTKKGKLNIC